MLCAISYFIGYNADKNKHQKSKSNPTHEDIPGLKEFILCWYVCDEYKELFPIPTHYKFEKITRFTEFGFYYKDRWVSDQYEEYDCLFKKDHILYQPLVVEAKIKMEEEKKALEQKKLAAIEEFNEIRKEIPIR